ncbi:MAG TPA: amidohydrolase family protein [Anaerohalosphaeraceae bacterium]|nr:amidohydrolase family protein [Anaerohalosphaeraceae bacterium]
MRPVIDFHTHAFPDSVAEKAMASMHAEADWKAVLDGRLSSLIASMDRAGIQTSVLCNIATRPKQYEPIFEWSKQIRSPRIVPFPSVHPADPDAVRKVEQVAEAGFIGMKFHPYYQDFDLDEPRMMPIYKALSRHRLITVIHTGFDIAFEWIDRAGPQRILKVLEQVPELKLITTHVGSWQQWDDVERYLLGKPVWMDISVSREFLGDDRFRRMLLAHPADYLLFGTDSPWADQADMIAFLESLQLPEATLNKMLYQNARRLLDHQA